MKVFEGTSVQATCTFTTPSGAVNDPDTVTVIYGPLGSATTAVYGVGDFITRSSEGIYVATIPTTGFQGQLVYVVWEGASSADNNVNAVNSVSFDVQQLPLPQQP